MLQAKISFPGDPYRASDPVRESPLFNDLTDEAINGFLSRAHPRRYQRGQYLFTQGESVRNFYIIQDGIVRLFRITPGGDEVTTDILIGGNLVCERKVFKYNGIHPDYALAIEDSTLLEFPLMWVREHVCKNPVLSLNMISILSQRSLLKDVESEHQATMSAAQLISCFLQWLCSLHDFDPKG